MSFPGITCRGAMAWKAKKEGRTNITFKEVTDEDYEEYARYTAKLFYKGREELAHECWLPFDQPKFTGLNSLMLPRVGIPSPPRKGRSSSAPCSTYPTRAIQHKHSNPEGLPASTSQACLSSDSYYSYTTAGPTRQNNEEDSNRERGLDAHPSQACHSSDSHFSYTTAGPTQKKFDEDSNTEQDLPARQSQARSSCDSYYALPSKAAQPKHSNSKGLPASSSQARPSSDSHTSYTIRPTQQNNKEDSNRERGLGTRSRRPFSESHYAYPTGHIFKEKLPHSNLERPLESSPQLVQVDLDTGGHSSPAGPVEFYMSSESVPNIEDIINQRDQITEEEYVKVSRREDNQPTDVQNRPVFSKPIGALKLGGENKPGVTRIPGNNTIPRCLNQPYKLEESCKPRDAILIGRGRGRKYSPRGKAVTRNLQELGRDIKAGGEEIRKDCHLEDVSKSRGALKLGENRPGGSSTPDARRNADLRSLHQPYKLGESHKPKDAFILGRGKGCIYSPRSRKTTNSPQLDRENKAGSKDHQPSGVQKPEVHSKPKCELIQENENSPACMLISKGTAEPRGTEQLGKENEGGCEEKEKDNQPSGVLKPEVQSKPKDELVQEKENSPALTATSEGTAEPRDIEHLGKEIEGGSEEKEIDNQSSGVEALEIQSKPKGELLQEKENVLTSKGTAEPRDMEPLGGENEGRSEEKEKDNQPSGVLKPEAQSEELIQQKENISTRTATFKETAEPQDLKQPGRENDGGSDQEHKPKSIRQLKMEAEARFRAKLLSEGSKLVKEEKRERDKSKPIITHSKSAILALSGVPAALEKFHNWEEVKRNNPHILKNLN